ncbi:MAG TPA: hypothetical protein VF609_17050 [Flavisolibacter sp.]
MKYISYTLITYKTIMMKRSFIFLLALGTMTSAFARGGSSNQNSEDYARDMVLGGHDQAMAYDSKRWPDKDIRGYEIERRKREEEIKKVNKDYDFLAGAVKRNKSMSTKEKKRRIEALEKERAQKLKAINLRYGKNVSHNKR